MRKESYRQAYWTITHSLYLGTTGKHFSPFMAQGKPYQWFVLPVIQSLSQHGLFSCPVILTLRAECSSLFSPVGLLLFPFLFGLTERSSIRKINKTMFLRSQLLSGYADPWAMLRWVCAFWVCSGKTNVERYGEEEVLTDSLRVRVSQVLQGSRYQTLITEMLAWLGTSFNRAFLFVSSSASFCPIYFRKKLSFWVKKKKGWGGELQADSIV